MILFIFRSQSDYGISNGSRSTSRRIQTELSPYKDFIATAVLAYCGNDIAKVEAKIRECVTSRGTSIKTKMEPFRQKYESIVSGNTVTLYTDLLDQLNR